MNSLELNIINHFVILGPEKRPHIPCKVVDEGSGKFRIEFTTVEVRDVDVIFPVFFFILLKNSIINTCSSNVLC